MRSDYDAACVMDRDFFGRSTTHRLKRLSSGVVLDVQVSRIDSSSSPCRISKQTQVVIDSMTIVLVIY